MTQHNEDICRREAPLNKRGRHAIVIGGSMAGLLAARVLADHFDQVTLLERDRFPDSAENRKGVPQGRHAHALLAKGRAIITGLFPDIIDSLVEGGATLVDIAADARWYHFGGYKAQFKSGVVGPFMSRPYLESEVRRRVLAIKNLNHIDECDVKSLVATSDRSQITGVRVELRSDSQSEATIEADLILDASGRGSRSPIWLDALGYGRPEENQIQVNAGYTSRLYRRGPGDLPDGKGVFVLPTPPRDKRMGALFPIEGDRWIVSLGGWLGDHAPTDEEGFLEFARSLPASEIYDVIKRAEPLTDFVVHKFPGNLRRRYEKMSRFPEGYLVTGDALCSFNPIYGQGMTVSALEAEALDSCLREQPRGDLGGLPQRFLKRAASIIDTPWMLSAGEDFRYPEVEGTRPAGTSLINWYVGKLHRAVIHDPVVYLAFLKVMNLIHPPTTLFNPRIAFRVLKANLTGRNKVASAGLGAVPLAD